MKKILFLAATAAMMLGLAACTDDPIVPIDDNGTTVDNPMVKSVDDLVGTNWAYTLEIPPIEIEGETIDVSIEFGLNFDDEYAHLTFPDNVTVFSMSDEYTLEEIEEMNFAYSYQASTTSGTLICGEMEIPVRYDETTDAILIDMMLAYEEDEDGAESFTLVFHRK